MQLAGGLLLFSGIAAAQIINCNSMGLTDGYQGKDWTATTKDCAEATNKLEGDFGQCIPTTENGCVELASSGDCAVSYCFPNQYRECVDYSSAWAAARVIHGRHKSGGRVGGYVSLNDYWYGYKSFVTLTKKGAGAPGNMRRGLSRVRDTPLEGVIREEMGLPDADGDDATANLTERSGQLEARYEHAYFNFDRHDIQDADGIYVNVVAGWGTGEVGFEPEMGDAREAFVERLAEERRNNPTSSTVRAPARAGRFSTMYEMEWVAHNNHDIRAINDAEMDRVIRFAVNNRAIEAENRQNMAMQVRRGAESIGHFILRVFRVAGNAQNVCG